MTQETVDVESLTTYESFKGEYHPEDVDLLAEPIVFKDSLFSFQNIKDKFKKKDPNYYDQIATKRSVFEDPDPEILRKYFPTSKWENFASFDPYFRWTNKEDKLITRKMDFKILTIVCFLFFSLNMDRGNFASAIAGGILKDLNLSTDDYNLGNNLRSIGFIIMEIPSQMVGKRFGPDWWMPLQVVLWSLVTLFQFFLAGRKSYLALRFLLGVTQGGFIADSVQYLSYYYTRDQMAVRLTLFWAVVSLSSIISNLMSIGLLLIHLNGKEGWRWLFLYEGLISLIFGIAAFFFMVPGPTQTKTKLFPNGYFTEKEEKIIANRLVRDDPSKSDMHNRQGVSFKQFLKALSDYDIWPLLLVSLTFLIPQTPPSGYLNIILRQMGFSRNKTIFLNIPIEFTNIITMISISLISELVDERAFICIIPQIWMLIPIAVEYANAESILSWGKYALLFIIIVNPNIQGVLVSWISRVSYSVRTRTVASPMSNIGIQLAGIVGQNIYRADDAPLYFRGNRVLIGLCCMNLVLFLLCKFYYVARNKYKKGKWEAMSDSEKEQYLSKHGDDGNKRLDYLFEH
ncbi:hypothetical protein QFC19_003500 [Naganishia cerealis]|uniref:Uncharacterized protein n=1 Tax=Naganishia cerealis TaxID=610337 RepID=A0ACC2W336_9TREE|nr:hypothetical protein QFC19_003500 [Naganishia cerealis]